MTVVCARCLYGRRFGWEICVREQRGEGNLYGGLPGLLLFSGRAGDCVGDLQDERDSSNIQWEWEGGCAGATCLCLCFALVGTGVGAAAQPVRPVSQSLQSVTKVPGPVPPARYLLPCALPPSAAPQTPRSEVPASHPRSGHGPLPLPACLLAPALYSGLQHTTYM
ncbi:hypothetical protein F5Y18DRAFT_166757 [Xylariaceae sp. FL1019]|nr:hypothetical protein F5Y18DRAFT_166757 [Xylariaceae sp. FL1019]